MNEIKKNDIFEVKIESWSSVAAGVCRIYGRAVFVKGAIPGETHRVKILKASKSAVFAKSEELISPSPSRTVPECPHFGQCGGCATGHISYDEELRFKLSRVNDAYRHIGKLDFRCDKIIGAQEIHSYRNKAIYAVGNGAFGFFRPRSHEIIPISRCLIQPQVADTAAAAVCDFMQEQNISAYDERTGKGLVRHVFTRIGFHSKQMQVVVITAGGLGAKTKLLTEKITAALPDIKSIVLCINKNPNNTVLDGSFYTLYGSDTIEDTLCDFHFELSPQSFYQINTPQAQRLYDTVCSYLAPGKMELIIDLYCGAGTISLCLAKLASKVIGAEIVPSAVENARKNAERNKIKNTEFICADAAQLAKLLAQQELKPDAIVVDPPRKGLEADVIFSICKMSPQRVVYVSCDVATQARDLRIFKECGYIPTQVTAVDMFPRTSHVETVVLLSKLKETKSIEVEIDLDEMDLTASEGKATYDGI